MISIRLFGKEQLTALNLVRHRDVQPLLFITRTYSQEEVVNKMARPQPREGHEYRKLSSNTMDIFKHAVESVLPGAMVKNNLKV